MHSEIVTEKYLPDKDDLKLRFFFIGLIVLGIPVNLFANRFYDDDWTVGEWLISYAGGFVRRGLPGEIIHSLAITFSISPILLSWLISITSLLVLIALFFHFCGGSFNKSFLLSQVMILAPVSEDYLVRKDVFLVCLYGLSLLALKAFRERKLGKILSLITVNCFSIIAILSHESYGIWALPSLFFLSYLFERSHWKYHWQSLFSAILTLSPSLIAFLACWFFQGNAEQAMSIHQSWQGLGDILPSLGSLDAPQPTGAIAAIGWGAGNHIFSSTLLSQFNLLIFWHPGMWLLTIFLVMRLFIGPKKDSSQKAKRSIICFQLLAFAPLFLYVDIGRWIFMWLASSALLYGFLINVYDLNSVLDNSLRFKGSSFLQKLVPGFCSSKRYNLILLWIGLPHCCWSVGRYIVSTPIGFAIKSVIFYVKTLFIPIAQNFF